MASATARWQPIASAGRRKSMRSLKFCLPLLLWTSFLATGCQKESASPVNANGPAAQQSRASGRPSDLVLVQTDIQRGHFDQAWKRIQPLLIATPDDPSLAVTAAEIQMNRGELDAARQFVSDIQSNDPDLSAQVQQLVATTYLYEGRLSEALSPLQELIRIKPDDTITRRLLVDVFHAQGRRHAAVEHLHALIRLRAFTTEDLLLLGDLERIPDSEQFAQSMSQVPSERHHYLTYQARQQLKKIQYDKALPLLNEALELNSDNVEAWVWLGHCYAEMEDRENLQRWLASRPPGAEEHPVYWTVLGRWFEQRQEAGRAAAAYRQALALDPGSRVATGGIARAALLLGLDEIARGFNERLRLLQQVTEYGVDLVYSQQTDKLSQLVDVYELLGSKELHDAWQMFESHSGFSSQGGPDVEPTADTPVQIEPLLAKVKAAALPPVDIDKLLDGQSQGNVAAAKTQARAEISLVDVTAAAGLSDVSYDWGMKSSEPDVPIYRAMGGGTAAIDYDLDGWPDLYFSVAGGDLKPADSNRPKRFYRNIGGRFLDVSVATGAGDVGYGQAVLTQDLNQDGADDLVVCNIGSLRVLYNAGDGTFEDAVEMPLHSDNIWVSTAAIADYNGDRLPDIYAVTYLGDREYFDAVCYHPDGTPAGCGPRNFPGGRDYLWLNQGDGSWRDSQAALETADSRGRGLGAIVSDIDGQPGLEIYVANDTSANDLLRLRQSDASLKIESLTYSGTGLGALGKPQGSMGLAIADLDHNLFEDLVVTNFRDEDNCVLLQQSPGLFQNVSRRWGMNRADVPLVGFGAQTIDFDRDSWQDLLVVNGHIEDETDHGGLYRMLPLLYQNDGSQFVAVDAGPSDSYLAQPVLARSLMRLDYDRDSRADLVITHTDSPAVVLANRTDTDNHWLQLELIGVECERAAVGTIVDVQIGAEASRHSLALGEGFYGSDQRLIDIGLGNAAAVDKLRVRWPDGAEQVFEHVPADSRYRLVQHGELEKL